MNANKDLSRLTTAWLFWFTVFLSVALISLPAAPVLAADKAADRQEATQLVEKARLTLDNFMTDNTLGAFRNLLKQAKGVLISPALLKGAFVIGVSGGNAVFLARDEATGQWSEPAFYTIGEASFGLQIGGEASEVILLTMTDRGVNSLLSNSVKLGGDAGVAAGPVGLGAAAATANLSADILSFSRSKGLYGGISLDGAVIAVRSGLNEAYYGKPASPMDILVRHSVKNAQSRALIEDLAKSSAQKTAGGEEKMEGAMSKPTRRG